MSSSAEMNESRGSEEGAKTHPMSTRRGREEDQLCLRPHSKMQKWIELTLRGRKARRYPDEVRRQTGDVIQLAFDALQVSDPISVRVTERRRPPEKRARLNRQRDSEG